MSQIFSIAGPAGALEANLSDSGAVSSLAILCHPHPRYGGSMDDLVLSTLADTMAEQGVATLRFNFRGVGRSEGSHSGSGGEVDDLLAVLGWVRTHHSEARLLLGGYSFGASIVSQVLAESEASRAILIAPPVGNLATSIPDGSIDVDAFIGDKDAFVDRDALDAWQNARIHWIGGADHFFSGRLDDLRAGIQALLSKF